MADLTEIIWWFCGICGSLCGAIHFFPSIYLNRLSSIDRILRDDFQLPPWLSPPSDDGWCNQLCGWAGKECNTGRYSLYTSGRPTDRTLERSVANYTPHIATIWQRRVSRECMATLTHRYAHVHLGHNSDAQINRITNNELELLWTHSALISKQFFITSCI